MNFKLLVKKNKKVLTTALVGALYILGWSSNQFTSITYLGSGLLILGALVGVYGIAKKGYYTLRGGSIGINTLVTIATFGAIAIGQYWEATAVVFLFSLGEYLEQRTMKKTRNSLQELMKMSPDTAIVKRDGDQVEVPAREVEEEETVIVRPGDKVPVDGEVIEGETTINQAPITGESAPVHKEKGNEVYAGTINQEGALEIRATGTGNDTTLQRIIKKVEEAQEAKAKSETLIEKFSKYYTPAIIALAIGTYALTRNEMMSLTLLVIGCPGALVIGPPVSIVSAIGKAAKNGVLMKGGENLEKAGQIDLVAFDKTGTLTKGETKVSKIKGFEAKEKEVLRYASIAEKKSEHHLGQAILDATRELNTESKLQIPDPDQFNMITGKGIIAKHNDQEIIVGNRRILKENNIEPTNKVIEYAEEREDQGETPVFVVLDKSVIGIISLKDEVRESAQKVISELKNKGFKTTMLTGDNERTARSVAQEIGVDEYKAELLPEDKQDTINELRGDGYTVAMVGDGVNDAPSLASADVGIAMGAAGTDTAIETADMALMSDELSKIPYAVNLSKSTRRNIQQNIGLAVLTVGLLLTGVLTSYVQLASGMLVHEGSVLAVILNGMRLMR